MFKDPAPAIFQRLQRKLIRNGYKTLDYLGIIAGSGQEPPQ